jgi:hypothetical protein
MELFIIRDGQQTGPVTEEAVQKMLKDGGLRLTDMGWRKGLPAWLPLQEVLNPGTERPTEPPPMSGIQSNVKARPATARQKALLQYIGSALNGSTTREEAAVAICDALENPKLTSRLAKWGEEKLRLHPDLFQEEIDYRRANRISRYLELCQTEGAEVIKDITKAHVQVLMESLDKKHSTWEQDARSALWDFLLPSVAENFPQLVQEEWKGKLRMGGTLKVAAAYASTPGADLLPSSSPSAFQAALRGVVYGGLALGLVISTIYLFRDKRGSDVVRTEPAPANEASKTPTAPAKTEEPPPASHPTDAPLIAVANNAAAPAPAVPEAPVNPPAPAPMPEPVAVAPDKAPAPPAQPAPEPAMAATPPPVAANAASFSPAPPPPSVNPLPPTPADAPAMAATPGPTVRSFATLTQPVTVQLQFGKVTLNAGTKVRLIALEGQNVRVNFNNNIVLMPIASTDFDPVNTVIAQPPAAVLTPTVPIPAPPSTPAPTAPTVPAAPKSPLEDL